MAGRRIACAAPPSLREQKGKKRAEGEWEGSESERAVTDTTGTPATKVRDSVGSLSSISSVIRAHTHTRRQRKKKKKSYWIIHTQNAIPSNSADSFFVYLLHSDNNNKITIFSPPFHGFNCSTVINPVGPSFCVNRRVLFLIQKVSSFQQQKRTKITQRQSTGSNKVSSLVKNVDVASSPEPTSPPPPPLG